MAAGIKLVQLRIKDKTPEVLRGEIQNAIALCAARRCQLVINDYWHEAIDAGASFVHLGQEDLAAADLPAIRRANIKIGVDRKSTRLNSSHVEISYAVFCLKKKKKKNR